MSLFSLNSLSDLKLLSERIYPGVLDPEGRNIIPFAFIKPEIKHLV